MNKISLNGKWKLYFAAEEKDTPSTIEEAKARGYMSIDADVPGNVEDDLCRAGIESDPYYACNSHNFRKYEFYRWWFERSFKAPQCPEGGRLILRLHGVNTFGTVWINGDECGTTDNMLIAHDIDITGFVKPGENHIAIRIDSSINKVRNREFSINVKGNENHDEYVWLRMSAHSFGWDIAPRLLSAGIWRDIELVSQKATRIKEVYYAVKSLEGRRAALLCKYRFLTDDPVMEGFSVRVKGRCEGHEFKGERKVLFCSGEVTVQIEDANLWWPRGYGKANLYDVSFELIKNGKTVDTRAERIGIRKVDIIARYSSGGNGEFKIYVNHEPIMAKGTNWSALDALHSRDRQRLAQAYELLEDVGCNILRCCGVNVYEDHEFFRLCDEKGIMVWQDFALACGVYPQCDEFSHMIEKESAYIIKKLRNHPSLVLWAGDNECDLMYYDSKYRLPAAKYNRISREVLMRAVGSHDPFRHYIPSSPYIPCSESPISENPTSDRDVPEQHCWGPRDYFKSRYYSDCTASFISEIGYHGSPSKTSIKKFISPEKRWPYSDNDEWACHSSDCLPGASRDYDRNELMAKQIKVMFGYVPETPDEFIAASQISQAEALKFFIENVRIKKWDKTGIMWWNLIDCWPQFSDAVVDYYFEKKLAFYYIKRVMQPVCVMMSEPRGWEHSIVIGNDSLTDTQVSYTVEDGVSGKEILAGTCLSKANENIEIGRIKAEEGSKRLYVMRWDVGGVHFANHYASGYVPFNFITYRLWLDIIESLPQPFDSRVLFGQKLNAKDKNGYAATGKSMFGARF